MDGCFDIIKEKKHSGAFFITAVWYGMAQWECSPSSSSPHMTALSLLVWDGEGGLQANRGDAFWLILLTKGMAPASNCQLGETEIHYVYSNLLTCFHIVNIQTCILHDHTVDMNLTNKHIHTQTCSSSSSRGL